MMAILGKASRLRCPRTRIDAIRFAVACCATLLLLPAVRVDAAACGGATVCTCGDTVVADYTLDGDLTCPPGFKGNALTIGADGITIDGRGRFTIKTPDNTGVVVHNQQHSSWTLRNVALEGGLFGIQSDGRGSPNGVRGITISNVDASSPQGFGQRIRFLDTHLSRVEGSRANGGKTGIYNLNGDGNHYLDTSASWPASYGPSPDGQTVGVDLIGVRDNLIDQVTARGRALGIAIQADTTNVAWGARTADRNVVRDSDFSSNERGISFAFEGDGNQYLRNDLSGSTDTALAINGDSGVVVEKNIYGDSFIGIALSNADAEGRTVLTGTDLLGITGTYGLRVHNVRNAGFVGVEIGQGARQSLWWSGGSTGNTFHQIKASGHTFGLLSQDAHHNVVTNSDFSWIGAGRRATGIDLRLGSSGNTFTGVTVHQRQTGVRIAEASVETEIDGSDLSDNHNCILAVTNDAAADQRFHDLVLNGCTGIALRASFDNLIDLRHLDVTDSAVGIALEDMQGLVLDGLDQELDLSTVTNVGLFLTRVEYSRFSNLAIGGSQSSVRLTTSHRNVFEAVEVAGATPKEGDGFRLDGSVENTVRRSSVTHRDIGLQLLGGSRDNTFQCNALTANRLGALNHPGATGNHLHLNAITNNRDFGVQNTDPSTLNAAENFWGAADGPGPTGAGNAVSGAVDVMPFFSAPGALNGPCGLAEIPALGPLGLMLLVLLLVAVSLRRLRRLRRGATARRARSIGPAIGMLAMLAIDGAAATPGFSQPLAYVANQPSATVSVIDTATDTVVETIAMAEGSGGMGVAAHPSGRFVYVANNRSTQAEQLSDEVVQLNAMVAECLPRVELADVLIEVDAWTGFTRNFTHAGGARSRNPDLKRHLYGAVLAQACNFGLTSMSEIADLTYRQLAWTTDWYLRG